MSVELVVPNVGESITEVQIGRWLKQEGEQAALDEPLVEIESDKATLEVSAPADGKLVRILKSEGEKASVGDLIGHFEPGAIAAAAGKPAAETKHAPAAAAPEQKPQEARSASPQLPNAPAPPAAAASEPIVMPAARRVMEQAGLKAQDVPATGPGGRITKHDAVTAAQAPPPPPSAEAVQPKPTAPAQYPAEDVSLEQRVPMSPMRQAIASRLVQAQQNAALLTTFNECDMSMVKSLRAEHQEAFQQKYGIKLGFMSFFVKAVVAALKEVPGANAIIDGEDIVYRRYYDIGIAVASGKGLVVPVLHRAELMSFAQIEVAIADFAARARENRIELAELKGGTFTISNGGIFGSLLSTPIVNPPQSAILGLHTIQDRPVAHDGQVVIRPMMYLALTYDHRLVDGREAVTFLRKVKESIENPGRMLLEV